MELQFGKEGANGERWFNVIRDMKLMSFWKSEVNLNCSIKQLSHISDSLFKQFQKKKNYVSLPWIIS